MIVYKAKLQETTKANDTIQVYLGNGCFWERQFAYFVVEVTNDAFLRAKLNFSARVGYAGGTAPANGGPVCYHTGDSRDYSRIGMAEVTRIVLDKPRAYSARECAGWLCCMQVLQRNIHVCLHLQLVFQMLMNKV